MLPLGKKCLDGIVLVALIILISVLSGCDGSDDDGGAADIPQPQLVSVSVLPAQASAVSGETVQFIARGEYSDDTSKDISAQVSWSSSDTAVATVNAEGLASAVSAGTAAILAAVDGITGSADLTVTTQAFEPAALISIEITPQEASVEVGSSLQFKAVGTYDDSSSRDITAQADWSSSDPAVATINADGLASAVSAGAAAIRAEMDGVTSSANLKVTVQEVEPAVLTEIGITPQEASVEVGETLQFEAVGTYEDSSTRDITAQVEWSSSDAAVVTIDADGLASAVSAGAAAIRAEMDGVTGSANLKVTVQEVEPAILTAIEITQQEASVEAGKTLQFKAVGTYDDSSTRDITTQVDWSSSNTGVATINGEGLATATASGTAEIRAEMDGVSAAVPLSATTPDTPYIPPAPVLQSFQILPPEALAAPGETQQFTAIGRYSDSTTADISGQVKWSSSDTSAATVGSDGLATAVDWGESRIGATLGDLSGSAELTVRPHGLPLKRSGADQFLLPVEVGNQTLDLLVDTASDALLVFEERLGAGNTQVRREAGPITLTDTRISRSYFRVTRTGVAATAPIRIGEYYAPEMKIMVVQSPNIASDRSRIPQEADGIIGLRRTQGLTYENETVDLDPPLSALQPAIHMFELDLPPAGPGSLSLGKMPIFDAVHSSYTFKAGALSLPASSDPPGPDLQVRFRAKSSFGSAEGEDLDVLLDSSPVNRLVLDTTVAESLGYDSNTGEWEIPEDEEIEFNLIGPDGSVIFYPKFKVSEVSVAPYFAIGSSFEAVLGIDRWQHHVIGFSDEAPASEETGGTVFMLFRPDLWDALDKPPGEGENYQALPELNSAGDDRHPSVDGSGSTIAFQSDRPGGTGGNDIYLYRIGDGLLDLAGINSQGDDAAPEISADGTRVAFHSDRSGNYDIYLYDLDEASFVDLSALNTDADEQFPALSGDGTKLAFQSPGTESTAGSSDIRLYDLTRGEEISLRTWANTAGHEGGPSLNHDGTRISFGGSDRADCFKTGCIYLYDVEAGELVPFPHGVNLFAGQGETALGPRGKYMAYTAYTADSSAVYLLGTESGETLFMPGLNAPDGHNRTPSVSADGEFIVLESDRPGGEGGYDIYMYQREEADNTVYTVSKSYSQSGTVTGPDDAPIPDAAVNAYDREENRIASAVTDGSGSFTLTIPQGVQLPITYETSATGTVVAGGIGNDIYVPEFEPGNLKFNAVRFDEEAKAGYPVTMEFDIETTTPAYDIYVKASLKEGTPSAVQLNGGAEFTADYDLTGLLIEELGQRGPEITEPIVKSQGDVVTKITYLPGTGNRQAHVEHTFVVPEDIADGTYTAVFSINAVDVNPADNALQGETDTSDNYMAAANATRIGNPDLPNLRIRSADLYSNSFELPPEPPGPSITTESSELSLTLEVVSLSRDTTQPVDIVFELEIDGVKYPMMIAEPDPAETELRKAEKQTYPVQCIPEDAPPEEQRCASLFRQQSRGKNYDLYIGSAAYGILKAKTSDTTCTLVITVDPENSIEEYENNLEDNVKRMPVMFLKEQARSARARRGVYPNELFDLRKENRYGNENLRIGYGFGPAFSYAEDTIDGITFPYAANFDGMNEIWADVFDYRVTVLAVGAEFDFNGDELVKTYFDYGVTIMNVKVYGEKISLTEGEEELVLWESADANGNERFKLEKEYTREQLFLKYGVPISVEAGFVGEVGLRGSVKFTTGNKIVLEAGPYAALTGIAQIAAIDVVVAEAGVAGELLLIDVYLKLTPSVQIERTFPIAVFRFEAPIVLSTLDGRIYLYAEIPVAPDIQFDLISWEGLKYEVHFFPGLAQAYGNNDKFRAFYYDNPDWSGTAEPIWEDEINHDWKEGGPSETGTDNFSALWEGYFYFPGTEIYDGQDTGTYFAGRYRFKSESGDDPISVWVDQNDDGEFDDSEKVIDSKTGKESSRKEIKFGYHKVLVKYREGTGNAKAIVTAGIPTWPHIVEGDLTGDSRLGMEDAIFALQVVSGLREGAATLSDAIFPLRTLVGIQYFIDENEENNTFETATSLSGLTQEGGDTLQASIMPTGDVDYYVIRDVSKDDVLNISIDSVPDNIGMSVQIFDADQTEIATFSGGEGEALTGKELISAGTYYIAVRDTGDDESDPDPYTINFKLDSSSMDFAFRSSQKYDTGIQTSVAINNNGDIVEVHKSENDNELYYLLGKKDGNGVNWTVSDGKNYDSGQKPSVALNDNGVVVEVHNSQGFIGIDDDEIWYHVGQLNNSGNIVFGKSHEFGKAINSSVAIDNSNWCILVMENNDKLWYRVGKVNISDKTIAWYAPYKYDTGKAPQVAMNNEGIVVEVHNSQDEEELWCNVGILNKEIGTIEWGDSRQYDTGVQPTIAIADNGFVVEFHRSRNHNTLWRHVGWVDVEKKEIDFSSSKEFEDGKEPSVACSPDGSMAIETHSNPEDFYIHLWYSLGELTFK